MAAWRRKALALFPDLRSDLERGDYTLNMLFFDLLPGSREAHQHDDRETLQRIYGFAEWCMSQSESELWNAAGVSFYEHVFDEPALRGEVVKWLSPAVVEDVRELWEAQLKTYEFREIDSLLRARSTLEYRETAFATGEVQKL